MLVASKQKTKTIEEDFLQPPPKLVLTPDQPTIVVERRQISESSDEQDHPVEPIKTFSEAKQSDLTLAHMIGYDAKTLKEK